MSKAFEVVLLHGLGRDYQVMLPMQNYLSEHFECNVHNISYPSMRHDFPELVQYVNDKLLSTLDGSLTTHFVGHSMGGILIRLLLQQWRPNHLGRVVQVGSPNQGTEVVDFLNQTKLFRPLYGAAASRLGTDQGSIIHELKPVDYEIGIIAANRTSLSDAFFHAFIFNRENDGLVPLDSTKISNMSDFVVVKTSHLAAIYHPKTLKYVAQFLGTGSFVA